MHKTQDKNCRLVLQIWELKIKREALYILSFFFKAWLCSNVFRNFNAVTPFDSNNIYFKTVQSLNFIRYLKKIYIQLNKMRLRCSVPYPKIFANFAEGRR